MKAYQDEIANGQDADVKAFAHDHAADDAAAPAMARRLAGGRG